ncbi:hypothetical protein RI367_005161 [Sorochytrium milnesiophthora]
MDSYAEFFEESFTNPLLQDEDQGEAQEYGLQDLPKKGSHGNVANYRPIAVIPVIRKAFEACLQNALQAVIEPLSPEQGGFRHRRGTLDHSAGCHQAYDRVVLPILWKLLADRAEQWLLRSLRSLFEHCYGSRVANRRVAILLYADDMLLVAEHHNEMQEMLNVVEEHARDFRYAFHPLKCEHLTATGEATAPLTLAATAIPQKDRVIYLGVPFSISGVDELALTNRAVSKPFVWQRLSCAPPP